MTRTPSEPQSPGPMPQHGLPNLGRLYTNAAIAEHWHCRWCSTPLHKTPRGAVICRYCDVPETVTT